MKIPLHVMNTYRYKHSAPSSSFLFLCICTFSTVTHKEMIRGAGPGFG